MKKESNRRASNYQIHFVESAEEFHGLLEVFREVFDWEEPDFPYSSYLANLLGNPHFLVLVAKAENQIVGGLTAYVLPGYQAKKSSIFIYDLGVATNFQRQGIGKSLIDKLLDYAKNHQIQDVFVDTELEDNEYALAFYQKTGFDSQAKVVQYTYDCRRIAGNL